MAEQDMSGLEYATGYESASSYYRAIDSFARNTEGRDGSAMVDLVAHRLEDSIAQRMLQLEQSERKTVLTENGDRLM